MKRFAGAFATEWLLNGGNAPNSFRFEPAPEALTVLKRDILKKAPDAALLAVDGGSASLVKPFLGTVPAYASGLVFDRRRTATLRDLDGLTIVEIPWLVTPGAPEFAKLPRRDFASAALDRLYALGLDAFRIAQAMIDGPPGQFALEGATGHVTLAEGRQFVREGRLATFRAGQLRSARWRALSGRSGSLSRADAGARAEGIAAEFLVGPRPHDRGSQFPHPPRRDRPHRARWRDAGVRGSAAAPQSVASAAPGASITAAKCARLTAAARAYLGAARRRAALPLRRRAARRLDPARIEWERDILSRMTACKHGHAAKIGAR